MSANQEHYVYRCYDDGHTLLYIGCAANVAKRMSSHRATKTHKVGRWLKVTMASYDATGPYADRATALVAEADAIRTEKPLFNTHHQHDSWFMRGTGPTARYLIDRGHCALAEETCCSCWPEYRAVGEADSLCIPHSHLAVSRDESETRAFFDASCEGDLRFVPKEKHVAAMRDLAARRSFDAGAA